MSNKYAGFAFSLQPDHETNKSPRRMQVSPPARNDNRSPIWNIWRPLISFLFRGLKWIFLISKGRLTDRLESTTALLIFQWTHVFLCCQSFDRRGQWTFWKIQVIQDKCKPMRVAMIWLKVKVNKTRLYTAAHFSRNEIKYQKSRESGLFQYTLYSCTIACLSFIPLYKQKFYKCYSLPPSYKSKERKKFHDQYLWQKRKSCKIFH